MLVTLSPSVVVLQLVTIFIVLDARNVSLTGRKSWKFGEVSSAAALLVLFSH